MSFRWVVDARGKDLKVDKTWGLVAIAVAAVVFCILRLLFATWIVVVIGVVLAAILVPVDIWLRSRAPEE